MSDPIDLAARLPSPDRLALFLDIDGTLIEPHFGGERRRLGAERIRTLGHLRDLLGDAVAVLTGRSIETGDMEFEPMRLPMGGLQGAEIRYGDGRLVVPVQTGDERRSLEAVEAAVLANYPTAQVYWKVGAMAVVCRGEDRRPFEGLQELVESLLSPSLVVIAGRDCLDIGPADANKGVALKAFMEDAPFAGRVPVHIGDDSPDTPAFAAAREFGGFGISLDRGIEGGDRHLGGPDDTWAMIDAYLTRWRA